MKRILVLLLVCLAVSCAKKEEKKETLPPTTAEWLEEALDLDKAVVRTPPPIVSCGANIEIEFRDAVIPAHMEGVVLDKNPFVFEPSIDGRTSWLTRRILRFTPDKRLPAGREVQATLRGKTAFGEQKRVNDFRFAFKVAEQEVLSLSGDFVPVPEAMQGVKFTGTLEFAQPVDVDAVRKDVKLDGPRGKIDVTIAAGDKADRVSVTSDVITRTDTGANFIFSLPGKFTASGDKWETSLFLAGMSDFRVIAHMDMTPPGAEQATCGFRFSDPIAPGTDPSGYVTVEPDAHYTTRVDGKFLFLDGDFVPGKSYMLTIAEGFPSAYGGKKAKEYKTAFSPDNLKPEVQWLSEGVYLPSDNLYKLQFKSVNVAKVSVRVTEILQQNIGFFLQNNNLVDRFDQANARWYGRFEYYDLPRVGEQIFDKEIEITAEMNKWIRSELDLGPVFQGKKNSVFVVTIEFNRDDLVGRCVSDRNMVEDGDLFYEPGNYYENPCQPGYYYQKGELSKLLIASDIGLTVKNAEDGIHVFATNVRTARPVNRLTLDLFSYQNKLLETQITAEDGYARFTQTGSYILGTGAMGLAVIGQNHPGWMLNNFDVGGTITARKGIDVFAYADRGVHRPGDTVHLSAIVRIDRAAPPEKQPVLLKVRDPKGQVVHEAKASCGPNGHVYFPIATAPADPTGDWMAEIKIGDELFFHPLKIETVKPNRLKVAVTIPDKIQAPAEQLKGTVTSKYLFGAPGANLRADLMMELSGADFMPRGYEDYVFSTPTRRFVQQNVVVFQGQLDAAGERAFESRLPNLSNAPGIVRGVLRATIYEMGGSFVREGAPTTIYPFTAFVGVKDIFRDGGAKTGERYSIPIVALDPEGKPVTGHPLTVKVYVNRKHWWWDYNERDQRDFRKMPETYLIGEYSYVSTASPVTHEISVEDYGAHFIEVVDAATGHQAGFFFYASDWAAGAPAPEKERNYLEIACDKNVYSPGDQATLALDTPGEGMLIFTLEQGTRVLHREWKTVKAKQTTLTFSVTEEMIPNCYASLSLIQPHNQNTNDVPMRLYGVKTLYVEDRRTRMPLDLKTPDTIRPRESFTVEVTSKSSRPGTATIAVVDDGLLDLTRFETPSPWKHFFQKIGLGVGTFDNYDQIMGVLFPDIDKHFTIGGGEFAAARVKRVDEGRAARFQPVVLFTAPLAIGPGETKRVSYTMPNYIGSVRIMVVGAAGSSYASVERTVPVKQEIMVLPTVPRVARPGDTFALPVSVFAADSSIRKAEVSVELSRNLTADGPRSASLSFARPGEEDAMFSVRVGPSVGADSVTVRAAAGKFTADYTTHLPVTSANPFYTEATDTSVVKGRPLVLIPEMFGLEGTNAARIAFSKMPDIQLDRRIAELIRYPYGCIEQTVSAVFPQIFLPYVADLPPHRKQAVTDNVNAAIKTLGRYRTKNGFTFWPFSEYHDNPYSDWGSTYAGHFLVEARALGYHVPDDLYKHWLADAKRRAKTVNKSNHRYQTYRLFVLALAGEPQAGAMNLVRENYLGSLDPLSKRFLAAAYTLAGMATVTRDILSAAPVEIAPYREAGGTWGSDLRDAALAAYLSVKMKDADAASRALRSVSKGLSTDGWFSTQETAMAVIAVATYYKETSVPGGAVAFRFRVGEGTWSDMTLSSYQSVVPLDDAWGKPVTIENKSDNPLFVTLFEEGVPLENRIRTENRGIEITRSFFDDIGRVVDVSAREQGSPFWVVYKVRSVLTTPVEELALSSVFPSGWEIMNSRATGEDTPDWVRNISATNGEYMDVRDDRINWFFDLRANEIATFAVKVNPTFRGSYALPPVSCEAMYSPDTYARIAGGRVTVK
jgi:uncharacterized protein YfaS (alpha-2-macroglobulin family)